MTKKSNRNENNNKKNPINEKLSEDNWNRNRRRHKRNGSEGVEVEKVTQELVRRWVIGHQ